MQPLAAMFPEWATAIATVFGALVAASAAILALRGARDTIRRTGPPDRAPNPRVAEWWIKELQENDCEVFKDTEVMLRKLAEEVHRSPYQE